MPAALDDVDLRLLTELEQDADRTNVELARLAGLSPAATLNRVRRLKDAGVISAVRARIDPAAAGFPLQAYVSVTLGAHSEAAEKRFRETVLGMPEVIAADEVAGETDVLLFVVCRDVAELQRALSTLSIRGGGARIVTQLRLRELKPRAGLPLLNDGGPPPKGRPSRRSGSR
jgi:Lrp/AsnC family transcriptional regulator, leucine-responsive regulatory protein